MHLRDFSDQQFAAYLAAFMDGEGNIDMPKDRMGVTLCLANTFLPGLEAIQERLGYGVISWQQQKKHWQKRYTWKAKNAHDCRLFLTLVRPYLQIKSHAADRALAMIAEMARRAEAVETRDNAVCAAAKAGAKKQDVAKQFGISKQSVSRILHRHEWPSVIKKGFTLDSGRLNAKRFRRTAKIDIALVEDFDSVPISPLAALQSLPHDTALAYAAGFIDGEGWLGLRKGKHPGVTVVNTDRRILDELQSWSGLGAVSLRQAVPRRKQGYAWQIQSKHQLTSFLETIGPLLQIKAQAAERLAKAVALIRPIGRPKRHA